MQQLNKLISHQSYLEEVFKFNNWHPSFTNQVSSHQLQEHHLESMNLGPERPRYHPRDLERNPKLLQEELTRIHQSPLENPKLQQEFSQIPQNIHILFGPLQETNREHLQKLQKERKVVTQMQQQELNRLSKQICDSLCLKASHRSGVYLTRKSHPIGSFYDSTSSE
jgi:hypothetical protein